MLKYLKKMLFCLLLFNITSSAQLSLKARADRQQYSVGDYIYYSLDLVYPSEGQLIRPDMSKAFGRLETIRSLTPVKKVRGALVYETDSWILSGYDSLDLKIGPSNYQFLSKEGRLFSSVSNAVPVSVRPLSLKDDKIEDIKDPVKIPFPWVIFLSLCLLFLALSFLLLFLRKKMKTVKETPAKEIILSPNQKALRDLEVLEGKQLWQNGHVKEYHTEITAILRDYFNRRFYIQALEMPTSEIISILRGIKACDGIIQVAEEFFSNADRVKFAKFRPMDFVNDSMMKEALKIVNGTVPEKPEEGQDVI